MIDNYLLHSLEEFFKEISYFNGNLYIINSLIDSSSQQIKADFRVPQDLWQTGTFFRDVTFHTDEDNLFSTGYGYDVGTPTLDEQSLRSISYVCCTSIANVYEVFDTFLKDTLANLYFQTEHKEAFKLKKVYKTIEEVRNDLWQVKSDKGFLKIIRRISRSFQPYEKKNIHGYNFGSWYNMIELTRHQIIHHRQQATQTFFNELKKKGYWKLFNENFSISDSDGKLIIISYNQASHLISNFYEYAFLIFKTLSIDLGLAFNNSFFKNRPIVNVFSK